MTTVSERPAERLLYSMEEAAGLLSISRAEIYRLAARGAIVPLKLGKRTLVPRQELERFVAERLAGAQEGVRS